MMTTPPPLKQPEPPLRIEDPHGKEVNFQRYAPELRKRLALEHRLTRGGRLLDRYGRN